MALMNKQVWKNDVNSTAEMYYSRIFFIVIPFHICMFVDSGPSSISNVKKKKKEK